MWLTPEGMPKKLATTSQLWGILQKSIPTRFPPPFGIFGRPQPCPNDGSGCSGRQGSAECGYHGRGFDMGSLGPWGHKKSLVCWQFAMETFKTAGESRWFTMIYPLKMMLCHSKLLDYQRDPKGISQTWDLKLIDFAPPLRSVFFFKKPHF